MLADRYDTFLVDIDGVCCRGQEPVPYAAATLRELRHQGKTLLFVTNNASRTPHDVAAYLGSLDIAVPASCVVTSAQAAARALRTRLPTGSRVLVIGGDALRTAVEEVGLMPVATADGTPQAVVQGWSPEVGWQQLSEGAYALAGSGIPWIATNTDLTVPKERGLAPGNGTLVAAVATAAGRQPHVVGKPEPDLFQHALRHADAQRVLVIGDRLDTDIAGARRAGLDSALVLTGATSQRDLHEGDTDVARPDHILSDLRDLLSAPHDDGHRGPDPMPSRTAHVPVRPG